MSSEKDRVEAAREAREERERASFGRAPRAAGEGAPVLSDRAPSERPIKGSLGTGIAHIRDWAESRSKRVAFLLAVFGGGSTVVSVAMTYWAANQGFVKEDRMAKWEATLRSIELSHKATETTVGTLTPRVDELEKRQSTQGEAIAALRPTITMTKDHDDRNRRQR